MGNTGRRGTNAPVLNVSKCTPLDVVPSGNRINGPDGSDVVVVCCRCTLSKICCVLVMLAVWTEVWEEVWEEV